MVSYIDSNDPSFTRIEWRREMQILGHLIGWLLDKSPHRAPAVTTGVCTVSANRP